MRKRADGLSEELSSDEEEAEVAGHPRDRLVPNHQTKPAPGLRKRLQNATESAAATKHQVRSTAFLWGRNHRCGILELAVIVLVYCLWSTAAIC